jgi:hypothetical protein
MIYPFVLSQSMDVSRFPTACEIDREGGECDRPHFIKSQ